MTDFYLDTSIWLDFYERRGVHGEAALELIRKIIMENHRIVYSDLVIRELKHLGYPQDEIIKLFSIGKSLHIQRIHIYKEQIEEAKKIALQRHVPKGDALHAILARDNDAILISYDQDFEWLGDITICKNPEEIM